MLGPCSQTCPQRAWWRWRWWERSWRRAGWKVPLQRERDGRAVRRGAAVTHTSLGSPGIVPSSPLKDLIMSMRKWSSSKILPSIICLPMPRLRMLDTVNLRVVLHSSPMEKNRPGQPVRNALGSGTEEPPTPNQTGWTVPQVFLLPVFTGIKGLKVTPFCVPHPCVLSAPSHWACGLGKASSLPAQLAQSSPEWQMGRWGFRPARVGCRAGGSWFESVTGHFWPCWVQV